MTAETSNHVTIDREGFFRASPIEQGVKQFATSEALAVSIRYQITEELRGNEWVDISQKNLVVVGDHWVIKKDGNPNEQTIDALRDLLGWDGNVEALSETDMTDHVIQVTVKADEYEGKTFYNVTWLNPYDYVPQRTVSNVDGEKLKEIQAVYGAQLRALCASGTANSVPASPSVAAPPQVAPSPAPAPSVSPPPPALSAAAEEAPPSTKESAWQACLKANGEDGEKATPAWHEALATFDKQESEFESSDWKKLEGKFIPF